jgi:Flp pilus assembly secretin CpaC
MSRRSLLSFALALGLGFVGLAAAAKAEAPAMLNVTVDEAKIARIPEGTTTLVIGNPIVADVTMLKGSGAMVVTGKGFGQTNLIALDAQGNVLDEKTILVVPANKTLLVQRGTDRESYSCAPQCMPTVQLGDSSKQFGDASGQIGARNGLTQTSQGAQTTH